MDKLRHKTSACSFLLQVNLTQQIDRLVLIDPIALRDAADTALHIKALIDNRRFKATALAFGQYPYGIVSDHALLQFG